MLRVYRDKIAGAVPLFPPQMEQRITRYLQGDAVALVVDAAAVSGPIPMTVVAPIREN